MCYNVDISTAGILLFIPTKNTLQPTAWSGYSVSPSSALMYIASEGQYKGTIPAPKAGNPDLRTNNYPVYEFVFYGEYPICQVNRIATIQTVTDPDDNSRVINLQKTKDSMDPVYIIGGIFNGPIPYPIENYRNYSPGTGELSAGTVTYGTSSKTVKGRKMAKSVAFGFEAELKTTEGVGPNFKMSFQAGTGSVSEQTTELDLISNVTQEANVVFDEELKNPSAEKQGVIKKMSVTMKVTAYSYLDEYGESIIATERSFSNTGMSGGTIEIGYDDSGDFLTFEPYDVIPGDLTSYMPEEINKLMTEKYQYKGSKYGYRDDNYFGDVICQNALPMDGKNYLEMSWDSAGKIKSGFTEIDRSYQENSWTYDGSIYAGVAGGGGFDLFGVGEKMEFSAMAGVDLSRDYSTSDEQQTEWGIDISDPWGPPSPGESAGPKAVKHYVFRLYFLPVPQKPSILPANHWTQELFDFLPANDELLAKIDKASACWKIYYVVTDIIYHDGTEISYNSKLDKQTIYDDDTLRGFGNVSN